MHVKLSHYRMYFSKNQHCFRGRGERKVIAAYKKCSVPGLLDIIVASKIYAVPNPLCSAEAADTNSSVKFRFSSTIGKDIKDATAKIKTTKSFGKDSLCYFLKLALPFIENSLLNIFHMSIGTSQLPNLWKFARVTPIVMEDDKAEMLNNRQFLFH